MEADDELMHALAEHSGNRPVFIATDGETIHIVDLEELPLLQRNTLADVYCSWGFGGRVDARGLLESNALEDPFESTHAVLIYQAPLFIGMEADTVVYVRNAADQLALSSEAPIDRFAYRALILLQPLNKTIHVHVIGRQAKYRAGMRSKYRCD